MNVPTLLTWVRVFGVLVFAVLLVWPGGGLRGWGLAVFAVSAATDFLDGRLARAWNQVTPFGRMLDSIADKLLVGVTLLVLAADGTIGGVHALAAILILYREIAISGLREHVAEKGVVIPASPAGKWKTTVQLVALAALIATPLMPFPVVAQGAGLVLLWAAAALTLWSGLEYAYGARHAFGRTDEAGRPIGRAEETA
jgi:CDP-diacylglycerol--glycerol-3-phosphate 3-phosphatidyltransferase